MRSTHAKRFIISIVVVLALAGSTLASCACSHHQSAAPTVPSCHKHTADKNGPEPESGAQLRTSEYCFCASVAPRNVARSEGVKLKKHAAMLPQPVMAAEVTFKTANLSELFRKTPANIFSSFARLKPSRAPPIL
jgi:hypothetical protein